MENNILFGLKRLKSGGMIHGLHDVIVLMEEILHHLACIKLR